MAVQFDGGVGSVVAVQTSSTGNRATNTNNTNTNTNTNTQTHKHKSCSRECPVVGADSRTTTGNYVANRVSDKLTPGDPLIG